MIFQVDLFDGHIVEATKAKCSAAGSFYKEFL